MGKAVEGAGMEGKEGVTGVGGGEEDLCVQEAMKRSTSGAGGMEGVAFEGKRIEGMMQSHFWHDNENYSVSRPFRTRYSATGVCIYHTDKYS